jgi:phosphonate transport system substrate-binding protein
MTRTLASAVSLFALLAAVPAHADWRQQQPVLRVGILSGENEADRLRRTACLKDKLEQRMGVPVEMYPASDYAGVMQGLLAGQLDIAGLGPVAYAGIYLQDPEAVEPVLVNAQVDGTLGYYAVIVVRADSGIETFEDLKGKTLAWADPNSASGFLYPKGQL